ncbi:MAG: hypothetical protein F4110_01345 [Acidimicrobiaceae bacterium]|nr:hypothetical protein [Acidimicrobiaceae bacterium]MYE95839.1 hypothetical protein [Acidimicrobiaceae bacterium]MYH42505.1 hypothetical protein [Acidimicrobiaceae bacterium]MYI52632.1 hypothetical protein [Acidimicrobiaceae bacterium]
MTETQRTTLYNQLTNTIGQEAARTLMEQLPPMGWDQVATKEDVKASGKMFLGELKETEGRLMIQIADSESRQGARIDETNSRIDETNSRIDETNRELSELKDEVRNGFADLKLALAKQIRWVAAVLLGFAVSMAIPLTVALL